MAYNKVRIWLYSFSCECFCFSTLTMQKRNVAFPRWVAWPPHVWICSYPVYFVSATHHPVCQHHSVLLQQCCTGVWNRKRKTSDFVLRRDYFSYLRCLSIHVNITMAFPFLKEASGFWPRSLWFCQSPGLSQTSEHGMLWHWAASCSSQCSHVLGWPHCYMFYTLGAVLNVTVLQIILMV